MIIIINKINNKMMKIKIKFSKNYNLTFKMFNKIK